jgi:hypothetical protein
LRVERRFPVENVVFQGGPALRTAPGRFWRSDAGAIKETTMTPNQTTRISLALGMTFAIACGLPDESTRSQPQSDDPARSVLPVGGVMDFTINKPVINRAWGASDKDVWGAGNGGMMVHWDGKVWRRIAVPTGNDLQAIWGASDKDVWAVGDAGVVIHWDGTSWARITSPVPDSAALNDVWGTSGSNVWAVGDRGVILQYNGSAWGAFSLPSINNLLTVWTGSTTDGWIGGDLGMLLRWDGTAWSEVASGSATPWMHIRGTASNKVWATKQNNEVWSFDGTKWAKATASVIGQRLWMTADNDIWTYSSGYNYHFTGSTWVYTGFSYLNTVWSSSPTSGWALTSSEIYKFSSGSWSATW